MSSEWSALRRALIDKGYEVELSPGSQHWKVYQESRLITTLPNSPSDGRAWRNALAVLRRQGGFDYRPKQRRKRGST